MTSFAREAARAPSTVFDRVVCLVDASGTDLPTLRVAGRVAAPDGRVAVVTVEHGHGRIGHRLDALLGELARHEATLAVVAMDERRRAVGIAVGSAATHVLHDAPCSVLVVPEGGLADEWPASITVGLDGSVESASAAAAAWDLSRRLDVPLRAIAATGRPGHAELELVRRIAPDFEEHAAPPVTALAEAAEEADLIVVGSRGLRGIRALGSISERVAHEAHCPVLVIRPTRSG